MHKHLVMMALMSQQRGTLTGRVLWRSKVCPWGVDSRRGLRILASRNCSQAHALVSVDRIGWTMPDDADTVEAGQPGTRSEC